MMQRLNRDDCNDVVDLSAKLGWDYSPEEISFALNTGYLWGCRNEERKVIATSAIFSYNRLASFGW